jgi:hypothetical protein
MDSYCTVTECEEPTRGGRARCDFHEKRHQRGKRGAELVAEKAESLSPIGRVLEAAKTWLEADSEDETDYAAKERAVIRAAKVLAPTAAGELVRKGMRAARSRGVRLGAPRRTDPDEIRSAVERNGGIRPTARALGISRNAIRRALREGSQSSFPNPPPPRQRGSANPPSEPTGFSSAR